MILSEPALLSKLYSRLKFQTAFLFFGFSHSWCVGFLFPRCLVRSVAGTVCAGRWVGCGWLSLPSLGTLPDLDCSTSHRALSSFSCNVVCLKVKLVLRLGGQPTV